jgi:hypothetical protein
LETDGINPLPQLFRNRLRLHDLTVPRSDLRAELRSETINAVAYKIGGIVFIIGSILFFPGGVFNYWRSSILVRDEIAARTPVA